MSNPPLKIDLKVFNFIKRPWGMDPPLGLTIIHTYYVYYYVLCILFPIFDFYIHHTQILHQPLKASIASALKKQPIFQHLNVFFLWYI